ncbi:hypothetical protein TNCV_1965291 [Trichonephila clavipes]|nr:hypothetical protein TNCV_1965291 [Trichonephila clavipes]
MPSDLESDALTTRLPKEFLLGACESFAFLPEMQKLACSGVEKEGIEHLRIGNLYYGGMKHDVPYFDLMEDFESCENSIKL